MKNTHRLELIKQEDYREGENIDFPIKIDVQIDVDSEINMLKPDIPDCDFYKCEPIDGSEPFYTTLIYNILEANYVLTIKPLK